jgi:hypothetical protein
MCIERIFGLVVMPGHGAEFAPSANRFLIDTLAIRNGRNPLKIKESDQV